MRWLALVAAMGALAGLQAGKLPAAKPKVKCSKASIHMTVRADGKGYVLTSAMTCTNGSIRLTGKRR